MTSGMGVVLDNFAAYTVSDVDSVVAPDGAEREFYFPGFLTSTRLISLELQVSSQRRGWGRTHPRGLEHFSDASDVSRSSLHMSGSTHTYGDARFDRRMDHVDYETELLTAWGCRTRTLGAMSSFSTSSFSSTSSTDRKSVV